MWWNSKLFLFGLSLQLMVLSIFSLGGTAKAAINNTTDGFIIQADRVEGSGMVASIVEQETSAKSGKEPMLRIQYQSATIYGMKLIKQVETPNGMESITLKAQGPVTVKGMTVDTTAISFKGACLTASDTIPELAMENVTMVAHYMDNQDSNINKLVLSTVAGQTVAKMPGKLQILQDISMLPLSQLSEEIGKISSGHLPLTCVDNSKTGGIGTITDPLKGIIAPVTGTLDPITKTLDPITKSIDPVLKPLNPVLKPLDPVINKVGPVLEPVKPVIKQLEPVVKQLAPVFNQLDPVVKQVDPIVSSSTDKVTQSLQSACVKMSDAKGVLTKELALSLIDEAMNKKETLATLCQSDPSLANELSKWQDGLVKSMELVDILGKLIPLDPIQQLTKMRDQIAQVKDGTIIYQP